MNEPRLNYPSVKTGGARENREAEEETACEWMRGAAAEIATRLTNTVGADATSPLCELIWQDQTQREE